MKIEKYISENRDKFNVEEPAEGHFERFTEKQRARRLIRPAGFTPLFLVKAAAVTLLMILSSLWLYERLPSGADRLYPGRNITLADISPEYREAEIYFMSLINEKYREIGSFDFDSARERDMLLSELAEMDSIYKALEKELNAERGNQMIVDAMIRHYQMKIDIMSRILDQLHQAGSAPAATGQDSAGIMTILPYINSEA